MIPRHFIYLYTFKMKTNINFQNQKHVLIKHLGRKINPIVTSYCGFDTFHYNDILVHLQVYQ